MPTQWTYPNIVSQTYEVDAHIPWRDNLTGFNAIKFADGNYITTTKELLHISNNNNNDIKNKTYYLYLKDFQFSNLPITVSGVEVEISINRGGRITDDTIMLMYNDAFISDNKADYRLDVLKSYGGSNDIWGVTNLDTIISDSNFGVGVRFQSHPSWPHRESPKLDFVRVRVW